MGFQKKTGKGRIDKWYKLAKEKGFRARAAFKLVQLNRRYGFLERSRVVLDLCAAPGSWCQVAAETMPANSILIGVDLVPIKPIPKAITIQHDISSDQCRTSIRHHLKNWKVDTVLHDGAPNVGSAWTQDAFSQAGLVLQSLKLASDFLCEGGTFVTKVFRSKDYNALLWTFNQLFTKVNATKPPASRSVSAEIFVVCQGFKAPKRLDPKLLDPHFAFAELPSTDVNHEAKVFNPEKKKRKREGYEDGDYIQHREKPASEFVQTMDPIALLGTLNRLSFEEMEHKETVITALKRLPETTPEILECCSDLRVLGRKEFRTLLRWRLRAREIFGLSSNGKPAGGETADGEVAEVQPMDEELQLQAEMQLLNEKESTRKKRERRRNNEKRQKEIRRLELQMTNPHDIGLDQEVLGGHGDTSNFQELQTTTIFKSVQRDNVATALDSTAEDGAESPMSSEDDSEHLENELDDLYDQYQERKAKVDIKYWAKKARSTQPDEDFQGLSDNADPDTEEDFDADSDQISGSGDMPNQKYTNLLVPSGTLTNSALRFFDQDIFREVGIFDSESISQDHTLPSTLAEMTAETATNSGQEMQGVDECLLSGDEIADSSSRKMTAAQDCAFRPKNSTGRIDTVPAAIQTEADSGFEIVKRNIEDQDAESAKQHDRSDIQLITAEAMTLAQQLASGQKSLRTVVDDGFNKYSFRDVDGLPDWFLDDEKKHANPQQPITAMGAAAIKEKLRALNARPIKKVREAKDRKKFKAAQRLEKLRKKSALLVEDEGISEKDKAANVARLMARAAKKKPKQQVKLVVAKGGNKGISGRPRGVKGKYKIVDARLKKDVKAEKRLAKRKR